MNRKTLYKRFGKIEPMVGAEIGVAYGKNSINILETLPSLQHLYLIDPWDGVVRTKEFYQNVRKVAHENLLHYTNKITIMETTSELAAKSIPGPLDFVYIDGDHSYDAVMLDIILWGRRVKPGGFLAGHDYVRTRKHGVYRAVNDYANYHNIEIKVFEGNWYWVVA
jgi:predicted O-methyltransferase YrrM